MKARNTLAILAVAAVAFVGCGDNKAGSGAGTTAPSGSQQTTTATSNSALTTASSCSHTSTTANHHCNFYYT